MSYVNDMDVAMIVCNFQILIEAGIEYETELFIQSLVNFETE